MISGPYEVSWYSESAVEDRVLLIQSDARSSAVVKRIKNREWHLSSNLIQIWSSGIVICRHYWTSKKATVKSFYTLRFGESDNYSNWIYHWTNSEQHTKQWTAKPLYFAFTCWWWWRIFLNADTIVWPQDSSIGGVTMEYQTHIAVNAWHSLFYLLSLLRNSRCNFRWGKRIKKIYSKQR